MCSSNWVFLSWDKNSSYCYLLTTDEMTRLCRTLNNINQCNSWPFTIVATTSHYTCIILTVEKNITFVTVITTPSFIRGSAIFKRSLENSLLSFSKICLIVWKITLLYKPIYFFVNKKLLCCMYSSFFLFHPFELFFGQLKYILVVFIMPCQYLKVVLSG